MILATTFLQKQNFIDALYIVAFSLFIYGMSGLTGPRTAVRGNKIAAVGMAIAVVATLLTPHVLSGSSTPWLIALGLVIGTAIGIPAALKVRMTAMPQMVALFNGVGGGAVALIAWIEYRHHFASGGSLWVEKCEIPTLFAAIVGSISFWGSNIAFGKLQEILPGRPIKLPGQSIINLALFVIAVASAVALAAGDALPGAVHRRDPGRLGPAREHGRAADRRRRHAGRDLASERVHRTVRSRDRNRAEQHGDDRRRNDRRRLGHDPHQPDGEGDEPVGPGDRRGRLRRRRRGARR